jgi:tyrosine recombinase XerC
LEDPFDGYLAEFLTALDVGRGYSPHTIAAYRCDLEQFAEFLQEEQRAWSTVDRTVARRYLVRLQQRALAPASVARKLAALRAFYAYLVRIEVLPTHPLRGLGTPKQTYRLPRYLSVDETVALLTAPDPRTPQGLRDRAILELLYSTGLRVSELVSLDLGDVDWDQREVRVLGKGGKERIAVVGRPALRVLKTYLQGGRPRLAGEHVVSALFLNRLGGRLTDRSVRTIVTEHARVAGLDDDVTPHTLRHTFATHLLEGGADLRVVQELLGHARLTTTQRYTHVSQRHLREAYGKVFPLPDLEDAQN